MKRMTLNAAELDKYIILTGYFHFQTEVLENVLEDELYGKLYRELQFCTDNTTSKGVLITDTYSNALFIGTIFDDNTMQLINFHNNQADIININIANDNELNIIKETETFLSEDNVKTLFGSQSIIGTGNIDLYKHQLTLNYDGEYKTLSLIVYSSSNLNVDSLQDLTTLLKPNSNTLYFGNTTTSVTPYTFQIIYDNNVWKTGPISEEVGKPNNNITSVSDIVTTI